MTNGSLSQGRSFLVTAKCREIYTLSNEEGRDIWKPMSL